MELRERIDALRIAQGLAQWSWADHPLVPQVTVVKAMHVTDLRDALEGIYVARTLGAPTYTDPTLPPTLTSIKAVHIAELRQFVTVLE